MASIDGRLLPLIDALMARGTDWLVYEILDGLSSGRAEEETPEELRLAREFVRSGKREARRTGTMTYSPPPVSPIVGDDQLDWVVTYAAERFTEIGSMLDTTLGDLDEVLFDVSAEEGQEQTARGAGVTLVLKTESDEELDIRRDDAARAIAMVPRLREALTSWANSIRSR